MTRFVCQRERDNMSEEHSVKRHCGARHAQPPTLRVAWRNVTLKFPSDEFVIVTGHRAHLRSEATLNSSDNQQKLYCVVVPPVTAVAQWLRRCATNRKVTGSIPAGVSGFFIDIKYFRSHYGPGVDSASNRNEYQECFLGVKAAGA